MHTILYIGIQQLIVHALIALLSVHSFHILIQPICIYLGIYPFVLVVRAF